MAAVRSVIGQSAPIFNSYQLLYVHCASKHDFKVTPCGLDCVDLVCRSRLNGVNYWESPKILTDNQDLRSFTELITDNGYREI